MGGTRKKKITSLHISLICMTMIPLLLFGVVVSVFVYHRFTNIMYDEVEEELKNSALIVCNTYEYAYEGDYTSVGKEQVAILKGEKVLNGNYDIIDQVKEQTGSEITVFFGNVRVLTTILDSDGNRIVGTTARKLVVNQVLTPGESRFYSNSLIDNKRYFSYYMPIQNSDGTTCGMVAVSKPSSEIQQKIRAGVMPILIMILFGMMLVVWISYRYSDYLIRRISKIRGFLKKTEKGDFDARLDEKELAQNDELGEMSKSVVSMQRSIKKLVEEDSLTELNNRRNGDKYLRETQRKHMDSGIPFSVAIADIDFFKRINDTYGHECGDKVLVEVSEILKSSMVGRGFVARWGGEEFLIVFDRDSIDTAYGELENIMDRIKNKKIFYGENVISITMTCGITEGNGDTIHSIIKRADNKLYEGKEHGRNKIVR